MNFYPLILISSFLIPLLESNSFTTYVEKTNPQTVSRRYMCQEITQSGIYEIQSEDRNLSFKADTYIAKFVPKLLRTYYSKSIVESVDENNYTIINFSHINDTKLMAKLLRHKFFARCVISKQKIQLNFFQKHLVNNHVIITFYDVLQDVERVYESSNVHELSMFNYKDGLMLDTKYSNRSSRSLLPNSTIIEIRYRGSATKSILSQVLYLEQICEMEKELTCNINKSLINFNGDKMVSYDSYAFLLPFNRRNQWIIDVFKISYLYELIYALNKDIYQNWTLGIESPQNTLEFIRQNNLNKAKTIIHAIDLTTNATIKLKKELFNSGDKITISFYPRMFTVNTSQSGELETHDNKIIYKISFGTNIFYKQKTFLTLKLLKLCQLKSNFV